MGKILDEDLIYEILSVVEEIPAGKVASYGQIARLIGWDKNSRQTVLIYGTGFAEVMQLTGSQTEKCR